MEDTDSQLFGPALEPLRVPDDMNIDRDQSDFDDDNSSLTGFDHLNVGDKMKNFLSLGGLGLDPSFGSDLESDDDTSSLLRGLKPAISNSEEINATLRAEKSSNKFMNFPALPPTEEDKVTKKKTRKPKEKKKRRRDKGKQVDEEGNLEQIAVKNQNKKLAQLFADFANESDSDEREAIVSNKSKKNKKEKKGRKTRKQATSNELKVDENGECLVRTTEFLDTTTDESSEDEERAQSKKQEIEMYRESERLRRQAEARLTPVYQMKSFDGFTKARDQRQQDNEQQLEVAKQREIEVKLRLQEEREKQKQIDEQLKDRKRPVLVDNDDDIELVIENDPDYIAKTVMSPERVRNPMAAWSPVRQASSLRLYNRNLLCKINNEAFMYRIKMEQVAKSRGQFASAAERAKKLLEKEKSAVMINTQIQSHFEKNPLTMDDDDDDEEDLDYNEQQDEEEEEEAEEELDSEDDQKSLLPNNKRKNSISDEEEGHEEMGAMAVKRWKGKKVRKSIFDDSDEDEEEIKVAKPVPAHSISNFFRQKEQQKAQQEQEETPVKLKRIIQKEEESEEEDNDAMEIEEEESIVKKKQRVALPPIDPHEKNDYLEQEADESEDEFYGAGGEDIDNGENLDEFEEDDLLVHNNDENVDEGALREAFNKLDAESDKNIIQRLLTDVTGGGLRKQKAAAEAGLMLEDIELYEDNDLIAIRTLAEQRRRRLLKKKGGDPLDNLLTNPKTAAFAKAAQVGETVQVFLSDGEEEEEEEQHDQSKPTNKNKLIIKESDDEQEESDDMMVSEEEDNIAVSDLNPMASPMRERRTSLCFSEEEQELTILDSKSPLRDRRTKSVFKSLSQINRFNRLVLETSHSLESQRVGFGSKTKAAFSHSLDDDNDVQEKKPNTSSIGGFLSQGAPKKKTSKLSALSKRSLEYT